MKNNILRILFVLLLVFTLSFTFFACNNSDNNDTTEAPQEQTEQEEGLPGFSIPPEVQVKIDEIYGKASYGPQEIRTVQQLAIITSINYTVNGAGPISVTPAELNGDEVTLITLGGTQFVEGQATGIEESALASQGKTNDYFVALENLLQDGTIPKTKPILITGISLGGMIAQQILSSEEIIGFDVKAVITFGSPLTRPIKRNGVKVVRFQDVHDQVPILGEMYINQDYNSKRIEDVHSRERIMEQSKYEEMLETHALSYIEDECWDKYDFLGSLDKNNVLILKSNMTFYPAPKITK